MRSGLVSALNMLGRARRSQILATTVVLVCLTMRPTLVVACHGISGFLGSRLSADLRLFLLAHPHDLLFEELHLIAVALTNLVLLPLFVLATLLAPLAVYAEASDILQGLQLVVEVHLRVLLVRRARLIWITLRHGEEVEVLETRAVNQELVHRVSNGSCHHARAHVMLVLHLLQVQEIVLWSGRLRRLVQHHQLRRLPQDT